MALDPFNLLLAASVFFVYGAICTVSMIFTFALDTYREIDAKIMSEIIPAKTLMPFEKNINRLDDWLIEHNKLIGPILILLSIIDMKLSFELINKLY